jgi:hypothetical protein
MMTILRVFRPHMTDVIDPNHTAVPGQVVRVVRAVKGAGENDTDMVITTPDGEIDLGFVSPHSLRNLPRSRSFTFDKQTGFTSEAKTYIA